MREGVRRTKITWHRSVDKSLSRIPDCIVKKFYAWVVEVELTGINQTRKRPGYHDEPLHGKRLGQRSVRLSRAWRIIYIGSETETMTFVRVLEVNSHAY